MNARTVERAIALLTNSLGNADSNNRNKHLDSTQEKKNNVVEQGTVDVTMECVLDFAKKFMDATKNYREKFMELKTKGDEIQKKVSQLKEAEKFDETAADEYENELRNWVEEFCEVRVDILKVINKLDLEEAKIV